MRKRECLSMLTAFVLMVGIVCSAHAAGQLPLDIRARFGSIGITDTAYWENPESTWFVLARTPDGTNMLFCFVLERGEWMQRFQTDTALPQGNGRVRILFSDRVRDTADGRESVQPVLTIMQYGTGDGETSVRVQADFLRSASGEWNLIRVYLAEEKVCLEISEDTITFTSLTGQDPQRDRTVRAEIERDLRRIDLAGIPGSPEEAESLSSFPAD